MIFKLLCLVCLAHKNKNPKGFTLLQSMAFISDQMCVPDFDAGAMENWGLVIYRETYLLFDNATEYPVSGVTDQYRIVSVIAHELAHQVACQE